MIAARTSRTADAEEASTMWTPTASSRPSLVEAWEVWVDILAWEVTASNSLKEDMEVEDTEVEDTDRASASNSARAEITKLEEDGVTALFSVMFDVLCCIIALL